MRTGCCEISWPQLRSSFLLLESNKKVAGDNSSISVDELTKLMDLLQCQIRGFPERKSEAEELIAKSDELINKLNAQILKNRKGSAAWRADSGKILC
jgi:capsule polysaccharide export protein KpsE/RkpR